MDYTQSIGNVNELQCLTAFVQLGYECSIPFGNGAKYDFIVDVEGKLIRIQCKSSHYVNNKGIVDYNAFSFSTCSQTTNTKKTVRHTYNSSQVDYFATYFNGNVYVVPVDECSTNKTLRLCPPSNGNKSYNRAENYLLENLFTQSKHYSESKENYLNRCTEAQGAHKDSPTCPICGKPVTKHGYMCEECGHKSERRVERPNREELKSLIRQNSFLQISKQFGVSDNAIRKWCKSYNLPYRASDIKRITDNEWITI